MIFIKKGACAMAAEVRRHGVFFSHKDTKTRNSTKYFLWTLVFSSFSGWLDFFYHRDTEVLSPYDVAILDLRKKSVKKSHEKVFLSL